MGDLSKNFSRHEFLCKGENCHPSGKGNCGFNTVDAELIMVLAVDVESITQGRAGV